MIVKTTLKTNFLWELCVQGPRIMPLCIQQSLIYQMVWKYFLSAKIWFFHYFPWVITLSKTRKMLISPKPSRIFAIWCENRIQREICVLYGYSYHPNWSIISKDNLIRVFSMFIYNFYAMNIEKFMKFESRKWIWPKNIFDGELNCESYRGIPIFQFDRVRCEKAEKPKARFRWPRFYYPILRH